MRSLPRSNRGDRRSAERNPWSNHGPSVIAKFRANKFAEGGAGRFSGNGIQGVVATRGLLIAARNDDAFECFDPGPEYNGQTGVIRHFQRIALESHGIDIHRIPRPEADLEIP